MYLTTATNTQYLILSMLKDLPIKVQTNTLHDVKKKYAEYLAKQIEASPNKKFKIEDDDVYELVEDILDINLLKQKRKGNVVSLDEFMTKMETKHKLKIKR
ncbi:MAG: hypothetical protein RIQ33_1288 [Bacteroidota bacterium]|jgi:hypothetical protein